MIRQTDWEAVVKAVEGLEFDADEGAYVEGERVFVQLIPVRQEDPHRVTLEILLGSFGVPADAPPAALAAAEAVVREAAPAQPPAVAPSAKAALWRLSLPRTEPGDLSGVRLRLRPTAGPLPPGEWEAVTDAHGRCALKDVPADNRFRLEPLPLGGEVVLAWRRQAASIHALLGLAATSEPGDTATAADETAVLAVAFSPDGRAAAGACRDGTVRLWDAAGREQAWLSGHAGSVRCVAFSPDGRQLVSGSEDRTVKVWDAASRAPIADLAGHEGRVRSVSFSPDGRVFASGSDDHTVRLWDAATGQELHVLRGHEGGVSSVCFSPDARLLASGSNDGTIRLWDAATGRELRVLRGHGGPVSSVSFSPDGRRLASGSDDNTARLWDPAAGRELGVLRGHLAAVTAVAFGPGGAPLASASADGTVRLWDTATGTLLRRIDAGPAVHGIGFGPAGDRLALATADGAVQVWEAASVNGRIVWGEDEPAAVSRATGRRAAAQGAKPRSRAAAAGADRADEPAGSPHRAAYTLLGALSTQNLRASLEWTEGGPVVLEIETTLPQYNGAAVHLRYGQDQYAIELRRGRYACSGRATLPAWFDPAAPAPPDECRVEFRPERAEEGAHE